MLKGALRLRRLEDWRARTNVPCPGGWCFTIDPSVPRADGSFSRWLYIPVQLNRRAKWADSDREYTTSHALPTEDGSASNRPSHLIHVVTLDPDV